MSEPIRQRAYSTKQVAVILGVPYEQVRRLIVNGDLAHLTIGRHFRVTEMELERFMNSAVRGTQGDGERSDPRPFQDRSDPH